MSHPGNTKAHESFKFWICSSATGLLSHISEAIYAVRPSYFLFSVSISIFHFRVQRWGSLGRLRPGDHSHSDNPTMTASTAASQTALFHAKLCNAIVGILLLFGGFMGYQVRFNFCPTASFVQTSLSVSTSSPSLCSSASLTHDLL